MTDIVFTLDRINRLRKHYGLHAVGVAALQIPYRPEPGNRSPLTTTPIHDLLDEIDLKTGRCIYLCGDDRGKSQNYVGARLARLERHAFGNLARYHFWLGADANTFSPAGVCWG